MGLVCFEGGTRGIYEQDLPGPSVSMPAVIGTEGKIKTGKDGVILLQKDDSDGWKEITPTAVKTNQYDELIDWIEGTVPDHRGNGRQARYTMEIMMAIYESLRIKSVVVMPLKTRDNPLEMMVNDGTLPVLVEGRYDIRAPFDDQK
jgi:hypothetical protein